MCVCVHITEISLKRYISYIKIILNYTLPLAISASSCEFVTTLGSLLRALERFG